MHPFGWGGRRTDYDAENNLNVAAVAASDERRRRRGKQTDKHGIETDSDRDVAKSRKRQRPEKRQVEKPEKPPTASKGTSATGNRALRLRMTAKMPTAANGRPFSRHKVATNRF